ncbi:MAG TPA: 3-phosphoglycerate dehydrogenase [Lachnospiraceae bacterium]|nr:3-phosphoglycerate dehydrogenase [Lachnospiraceae bacterium]
MFAYHCLNPISRVGLDRFTENYMETADPKDADVYLVRSAKLLDASFGPKLTAIARAGAGVNNIPLDRCAENGIVVFNTPGANANAVKELVLAGLLLSSRDITGGIEWVKNNAQDPSIAKDAEKIKKQFAGNEIYGKKLGIIGLGAIGQLVANAAVALGMEVYGYDPFLSVDAAWNLSSRIHHIQNVDDIYQASDYITIHVPATDTTKGMIGRKAFKQMKKGVVILNYARDVLVDPAAMKEALADGTVRRYMTDFATPDVASMPNTIVTPHLGASTEEAEDNCAQMAVKEIRDFLENGNITHSVNYPDLSNGVLKDACRLTICHRNVKDMIRQFTLILSSKEINIANMINKSRGDYAYTMIDVESDIPAQALDEIKAVDGVLRARTITK